MSQNAACDKMSLEAEMGRYPQDVTDAELAILKVLWNDSPATIRQITEQLYPRGSDSDYATVKKLLARLEDKRCVRKNRRQIPHRFTPAITLDDLVGRRLQMLANHLCDWLSSSLADASTGRQGDFATATTRIARLDRRVF